MSNRSSVSSKGDRACYKSLSEGLAHLRQNGGAISLEPGSYDEKLSLPNNIEIKGCVLSRLTGGFKADSDGRGIVIRDATIVSNGLILAGFSDINFYDCVFEINYDGYDKGKAYKAINHISSNVSYYNCKFNINVSNTNYVIIFSSKKSTYSKFVGPQVTVNYRNICTFDIFYFKGTEELHDCTGNIYPDIYIIGSYIKMIEDHQRSGRGNFVRLYRGEHNATQIINNTSIIFINGSGKFTIAKGDRTPYLNGLTAVSDMNWKMYEDLNSDILMGSVVSNLRGAEDICYDGILQPCDRHGLDEISRPEKRNGIVYRPPRSHERMVEGLSADSARDYEDSTRDSSYL